MGDFLMVKIDELKAELAYSQAREEALRGLMAGLILATEAHHLNPFDLEKLSKYAEAKRLAADAIEYGHHTPGF